jgi:hypothetical protein
MMLPIFYVDPYTGNIFVLVAFTIVVLGGMGSVGWRSCWWVYHRNYRVCRRAFVG